MFDFELNGKVYNVDFEHETVEVLSKDKMIPSYTGKTRCTISIYKGEDLKDKEVIATGFSEAQVGDTPNKNIGRFYALYHALSPKVLDEKSHKYITKHNFDKEFRAFVWGIYFQLSNPKKKNIKLR